MDIEKQVRRARLPLVWVAGLLATAFSTGVTFAFAKAGQAATHEKVVQVELRTGALEKRTEDDRLDVRELKTNVKTILLEIQNINRKLEGREP